jgi:3-keto-disaccharide hydrolase
MKSLLSLAGLLVACGTTASAADEWIALFDGKDLSRWQSASGGPPPPNWVVADGAVTRQGGGGDLWSKERFGDFVLELEFKAAGNSGVFFRTDNPKDNVQTGIEIQIDKPGGPDKHSVGAIYDLVAPTKNAALDGWNKLIITAMGPRIAVELNGEKINRMNLDLWKEAQKNPDGSGNKFRTALKDFKREGHIGLQDHGNQVSYRNIRVKRAERVTARPPEISFLSCLHAKPACPKEMSTKMPHRLDCPGNRLHFPFAKLALAL